MKQHSDKDPTACPYNKAVSKAYQSILRLTKQLLCQFERDELRYTLQRADKTTVRYGTVIHEMVNPLFYLRLECYEDNLFAIQYGFETIRSDSDYSKAIALFTRYIYKVTSKDKTNINIEGCVKTSYCIYTCSDLYDYMEEHSKSRTFSLIKYKSKAKQRKRTRSVA